MDRRQDNTPGRSQRPGLKPGRRNEGFSHNARDAKGGLDGRNERDVRGARDARDSRDMRDTRDIREDSDGGLGLIIGRNPVIEALKADKPIDSVYVNKDGGGSLAHIIDMAKKRDIVVKEVTSEKLNHMAGGASHQGVIAQGACAEYSSIADILELARSRGEQPFVIICDEIEDPHNLGAIIRTAESAGAHGVIIPKRRSASLNSTVFKTSAGAASWLPVARVANIPAAIDELKQNGVWIYGTDASGQCYDKVSLSGAVGLVIGSEGFGMGRLVASKCDFLISLPMNGKITSLNASVAAGIFMYEVVRQRKN